MIEEEFTSMNSKILQPENSESDEKLVENKEIKPQIE